MASGAQGPKQTKGYFVTLATLSTTSQFYQVNAGGAGGSFTPGNMLSNQGSGTFEIPANRMLKDMGKTVVSTSHTFRKVQLLLVSGPNTTAGATTAANGLPFYIELSTGQNSQAAAAQVAYLPGLM